MAALLAYREREMVQNINGYKVAQVQPNRGAGSPYSVELTITLEPGVNEGDIVFILTGKHGKFGRGLGSGVYKLEDVNGENGKKGVKVKVDSRFVELSPDIVNSEGKFDSVKFNERYQEIYETVIIPRQYSANPAGVGNSPEAAVPILAPPIDPANIQMVQPEQHILTPQQKLLRSSSGGRTAVEKAIPGIVSEVIGNSGNYNYEVVFLTNLENGNGLAGKHAFTRVFEVKWPGIGGEAGYVVVGADSTVVFDRIESSGIINTIGTAIEIGRRSDLRRSDTHEALNMTAYLYDTAELIRRGESFTDVIVNLPLHSVNDIHGHRAGNFLLFEVNRSLLSQQFIDFCSERGIEVELIANPYRRGANYTLRIPSSVDSQKFNAVLFEYLMGDPARGTTGELQRIMSTIEQRFPRLPGKKGEVFYIPSIGEVQYKKGCGASAFEHFDATSSRMVEMNVWNGIVREFYLNGEIPEAGKIVEMLKKSKAPTELIEKFEALEKAGRKVTLFDLFGLETVETRRVGPAPSEVSSPMFEKLHEQQRAQTSEAKDIRRLLEAEGQPEWFISEMLSIEASHDRVPETPMYERVVVFKNNVESYLDAQRGSPELSNIDPKYAPQDIVFSVAVVDGDYFGSWIKSYDSLGAEIIEKKIYPEYHRVSSEYGAPPYREPMSEEMHLERLGTANELDAVITETNNHLATGNIPRFMLEVDVAEFSECPIVRRLGIDFFTDPNGPVKAEVFKENGVEKIRVDIRNLPREDRRTTPTKYRLSNGRVVEAKLTFGISFTGRAVEVSPERARRYSNVFEAYEEIHKEANEVSELVKDNKRLETKCKQKVMEIRLGGPPGRQYKLFKIKLQKRYVVGRLLSDGSLFYYPNASTFDEYELAVKNDWDGRYLRPNDPGYQSITRQIAEYEAAHPEVKIREAQNVEPKKVEGPPRPEPSSQEVKVRLDPEEIKKAKIEAANSRSNPTATQSAPRVIASRTFKSGVTGFIVEIPLSAVKQLAKDGDVDLEVLFGDAKHGAMGWAQFGATEGMAIKFLGKTESGAMRFAFFVPAAVATAQNPDQAGQIWTGAVLSYGGLKAGVKLGSKFPGPAPVKGFAALAFGILFASGIGEHVFPTTLEENWGEATFGYGVGDFTENKYVNIGGKALSVYFLADGAYALYKNRHAFRAVAQYATAGRSFVAAHPALGTAFRFLGIVGALATVATIKGDNSYTYEEITGSIYDLAKGKGEKDISGRVGFGHLFRDRPPCTSIKLTTEYVLNTEDGWSLYDVVRSGQSDKVAFELSLYLYKAGYLTREDFISYLRENPPKDDDVREDMERLANDFFNELDKIDLNDPKSVERTFKAYLGLCNGTDDFVLFPGEEAEGRQIVANIMLNSIVSFKEDLNFQLVYAGGEPIEEGEFGWESASFLIMFAFGQ